MCFLSDYPTGSSIHKTEHLPFIWWSTNPSPNSWLKLYLVAENVMQLQHTKTPSPSEKTVSVLVNRFGLCVVNRGLFVYLMQLFNRASFLRLLFRASVLSPLPVLTGPHPQRCQSHTPQGNPTGVLKAKNWALDYIQSLRPEINKFIILCTIFHLSVQSSRSVVSDPLRPMDCSTPGLPVHHQIPELTQTHVHQVSDAIQPSHPLSSPSPIFNLSQHQGLFQWISS